MRTDENSEKIEGDIKAAKQYYDSIYNELMNVNIFKKGKPIDKILVSPFEEHGKQDFFSKIPLFSKEKLKSRELESKLVDQGVEVVDGFWEDVFSRAKDPGKPELNSIKKKMEQKNEEINGLLEKFGELLQSMVPGCNPNNENHLDIISAHGSVELPKKQPETKPQFELIDFSDPPSPKLHDLLWRSEDLHKFYHDIKLFPLKENLKSDGPREVVKENLFKKKQEVLFELLKESALGKDFSNAGKIGVQRLRQIIISTVKIMFRDVFAGHTIEDQIIALSGKKGLSGSPELKIIIDQINKIDRYVQMAGNKLKTAGVNDTESGNNTMRFIFLPNLYSKFPCSNLKSTGGACPKEEDSTVDCKKYDKCLKQEILKIDGKINIIHPEPVDDDDIENKDFEWSQLHEIHVLNVFHGFPLENMEQMVSKAKNKYEQLRDSRKLLIACPSYEEDFNDYYDIEARFPDENINVHVRKLLLLFAGGLLKYDRNVNKYKYITIDQYKRLKNDKIDTESVKKYEGTFELDEEVISWLMSLENIEGAKKTRSGFGSMFSIADEYMYAIREHKNYDEKYNLYIRLAYLQYNLTYLHSDIDEWLSEKENNKVKFNIDVIRNELAEIAAGIKTKYETKIKNVQEMDIKLNVPLIF